MPPDVKIRWTSVLWESVKRLNPAYLFGENPIMFVVELGAFFTAVYAILEGLREGAASALHVQLLVILLATVWFSTLSESISEHQARARVDYLRSLEKDVVAHKLVGDRVVDVRSSELMPGDVVVVGEGEYVPRDGYVLEGIAYVDESMLTGESEPVEKKKDDRVIGGTRVVRGRIRVEIVAEPGKSYIDRLMALIQTAKRPKMKSEVMLSILLGGLSLTFLVITASLYFALRSVGGWADPVLAVAFLVALMPTTIGGLLPAIGVAGVTRLMAENIVAKSGKAVEAAGDVDVIVFDKTGTITEGSRSAVAFIPLKNYTERDVAVAAYLASVGDRTHEGISIIELAKSKGYVPEDLLVNEALSARKISFDVRTRFSGVEFSWYRRKSPFAWTITPLSEVSRRILEARERGERVTVIKGSVDSVLEVVREDRATREAIARIVEEVGRRGETPLLVALNDEAVGIVVLKDRIKEGVKEKIRRLKKMGVKLVMITGDNPVTAEAIAREVGIKHYVARAKPEDKLRRVEEEQLKGHVVAVLGDGTNDAPALAKADVGIAMNSGTRAAKEAANMIDLDSDPTKVVRVVEVGRELQTTRGAITTFSIMNDIAKYFTIFPMIVARSFPQLSWLNFMGLHSPESAILATMIFNAVIIPSLIPLALRGAGFKVASYSELLARNLLVYGLGGVVTPFVAIKLIDVLLVYLGVG